MNNRFNAVEAQTVRLYIRTYINGVLTDVDGVNIVLPQQPTITAKIRQRNSPVVLVDFAGGAIREDIGVYYVDWAIPSSVPGDPKYSQLFPGPSDYEDTWYFQIGGVSFTKTFNFYVRSQAAQDGLTATSTPLSFDFQISNPVVQQGAIDFQVISVTEKNGLLTPDVDAFPEGEYRIRRGTTTIKNFAPLNHLETSEEYNFLMDSNPLTAGIYETQIKFQIPPSTIGTTAVISGSRSLIDGYGPNGTTNLGLVVDGTSRTISFSGNASAASITGEVVAEVVKKYGTSYTASLSGGFVQIVAASGTFNSDMVGMYFRDTSTQQESLITTYTSSTTIKLQATSTTGFDGGAFQVHENSNYLEITSQTNNTIVVSTDGNPEQSIELFSGQRTLTNIKEELEGNQIGSIHAVYPFANLIGPGGVVPGSNPLVFPIIVSSNLAITSYDTLLEGKSFIFKANGETYTVTFSGLSNPFTLQDIVDTIDAELNGCIYWYSNGGQVRLILQDPDVISLEILGGTANGVLGFKDGATDTNTHAVTNATISVVSNKLVIESATTGSTSSVTLGSASDGSTANTILGYSTNGATDTGVDALPASVTGSSAVYPVNITAPDAASLLGSVDYSEDTSIDGKTFIVTVDGTTQTANFKSTMNPAYLLGSNNTGTMTFTSTNNMFSFASNGGTTVHTVFPYGSITVSQVLSLLNAAVSAASQTTVCESVNNKIKLRSIPKSGTLSSVANAGAGNVTFTATAHGMVSGEKVTIQGTTNYNGTYTISAVATNTFTVAATYIAEAFSGATYYASSVTVFNQDNVLSTDATEQGFRFQFIVQPVENDIIKVGGKTFKFKSAIVNGTVESGTNHVLVLLDATVAGNTENFRAAYNLNLPDSSHVAYNVNGSGTVNNASDTILKVFFNGGTKFGPDLSGTNSCTFLEGSSTAIFPFGFSPLDTANNPSSVTISSTNTKATEYKSSITLDTIVSTINNAFTPTSVCSRTNNRLLITSPTTGGSSTITVGNGTANTLLGFTNAQADTGAAGNVLQIQVNGGSTQTISFSTGIKSLDTIVNEINFQAEDFYAESSGGQLKLATTDAGGTYTIQVIAADALFGSFSNALQTGSNATSASITADNAVVGTINITATENSKLQIRSSSNSAFTEVDISTSETLAQAAALISAAAPGYPSNPSWTATAAGGQLTIQSSTFGGTSYLEIGSIFNDSTANLALGISDDGVVATGSDGSPIEVSEIVNKINAAFGGNEVAENNGGVVRFVSKTTGANSSVEVLSSTSTDVLLNFGLTIGKTVGGSQTFAAQTILSPWLKWEVV